MIQSTVAVLWTAAIVAIALIDGARCSLQVKYQWKQIDFAYPSADDRQNAIDNLTFIPENVIPVGLEVYEHRLFVTLPRWKNGVPASLAYINLNGKRSLVFVFFFLLLFVFICYHSVSSVFVLKRSTYVSLCCSQCSIAIANDDDDGNLFRTLVCKNCYKFSIILILLIYASATFEVRDTI